MHVKENWPVEYECSECLSVDVLGYDHQRSVLGIGKLQRGNQRLSRGDLTFTEQYQSILELTLRSCIQADRQQPWASCSHHIHVSWNSHFAPVYKQTDTTTLGKLFTPMCNPAFRGCQNPINGLCVLELKLGSRTYTDNNLGQVTHITPMCPGTHTWLPYIHRQQPWASCSHPLVSDYSNQQQPWASCSHSCD